MDGRFELDNSRFERAIREVAIGRKTSCSPAPKLENGFCLAELRSLPPEAWTDQQAAQHASSDVRADAT
jgi:hypothetical protein